MIGRPESSNCVLYCCVKGAKANVLRSFIYGMKNLVPVEKLASDGNGAIARTTCGPLNSVAQGAGKSSSKTTERKKKNK